MSGLVEGVNLGGYKYDNRAPTKDRVVAKKAVARSFIFQ